MFNHHHTDADRILMIYYLIKNDGLNFNCSEKSLLPILYTLIPILNRPMYCPGQYINVALAVNVSKLYIDIDM